MEIISFDPAKSERNRLIRGFGFELAAEFCWDEALIVEDLRRDYGERRFKATGLIHARLHVLVFTPRARHIHVISLRKANVREIRLHTSSDTAG